MSNRFPCDDVQVNVQVTVPVEPINKNTMKKALAKIEHLTSLLKDYEGNVSITEIVSIEELKQFAKQENQHLFPPTSYSPYYWIKFNDGNLEIQLKSKDLKRTVPVWEE